MSATITSLPQQLSFDDALGQHGVADPGHVFRDPTAAKNKFLPIHRWVNWIAGFSGTFTASCIDLYLPDRRPGATVLDPFAGVGTTLVEAYRRGFDTVGFEINHFAALVAETKLQCTQISEPALADAIAGYAKFMRPIERELDHAQGSSGKGTVDLSRLPAPRTRPPKGFRSKVPFFAPLVERKVLFSLDYIASLPEELRSFFQVALGAVMVSVSNYSYEPSLSSRASAGRSPIVNAPVSHILVKKLREMTADQAALRKELASCQLNPAAAVYRQSFFSGSQEVLADDSVDLVITSPPYMNNYHYVRNTRPQLFWLDFISNASDLKALEDANYGRYWQSVRDGEPIHLNFDLPEASLLVDRIRSIKPEKGAYGGPGWANYVACYLNDTEQFCSILARVLRPSGKAVIVVGNSVIQGVEVQVDRFFSLLGEKNGLKTIGIYVIRGQRVGSSIVNTGLRENATKKIPLYDAAVVLQKP